MFPFPLSPFQQEAIQAIQDGHHVLVTAHTGSGKTLPAEFAIGHFKKKIVYTSPIKALSNQKFAEFSRKFPHISFGLLTGDIKTNPDAQVLIMTTEILMNALFRRQTTPPSSDTKSLQFTLNVETDLDCVIFDEIHYINDAERGHVWEKTILMLPPHVQMVMLSATIDDPVRFARWIETNKQKRVVLASTLHRVVPLTHYSFLTVSESRLKTMDKATQQLVRATTQDLIPLLTPQGVFQEVNYQKVQKMIKTIDAPTQPARKFVLNQLLLFLRDRAMLPAICFVFSRKAVEMCAQEITIPLLEDDSKVGYTVARECEQILRKLPNYQEYMQTAEFRLVVGLLEKGIGIHHSGMIPVLRELVELMIAKKYIKVLFATESFAIGLDCPIKTAVFTSLTKFDGHFERLLHSHEYTQMAGRAGRRGIDTVGHVVHCNNLFLPILNEYRDVLSGKPQKLVSKFAVSFKLVLSLLSNAGRLSLEECGVFVQQTLRSLDLKADMASRQAELDAKRAEVDRIEAALVETLVTPVAVCRAYLEMELALPMSVNRKRKTLEKDMRALVDQHRTLLSDAQRVHVLDVHKKEAHDMGSHVHFLQSFMMEQLRQICDVMVQEGFLTLDDDNYQLTSPLGTVASGIAEIHPLIMTSKLVSWEWFADFSVAQIIGILSCFTDVKVVEQERRTRPHCRRDRRVEMCAEELLVAYQKFQDLWIIPFTDADLNCNLMDWTLQWVACENEGECRAFLQENQSVLGVSAGDFTKAMLKISTIAKELSSVAEAQGQLECLLKLSQVDAAILKYVATCQSLYV